MNRKCFHQRLCQLYMNKYYFKRSLYLYQQKIILKCPKWPDQQILFHYIISMKMKKMNCTSVLIANFDIQLQTFEQYNHSIIAHVSNYTENKQLIRQVTKEQLIEGVKTDKRQNDMTNIVGIVLAKSGVPECKELNRQSGIRAALVHTRYIAQMCRQHNDANICIIGTDCIGHKLAAELSLNYLCSSFDYEVKNKLRLGIIRDLEAKYEKQQANFCQKTAQQAEKNW